MAIKVKNLNLEFQDGTILYENCDFEIKNDKITVILGLNGVGKSTLFKIISNEIKTNALIENDFKKVFYLPQAIACPKGITTFDYLSTLFFKNGFKWLLTPEEREKTLKTLKSVSLLRKKNVDVDKLSGGEFQKLNLALSLLIGADLLLLDEPVSSLDIINQKFVLDTIKGFKTSTAVILHDLNLAYEFGDEFIGIDKNHKIIQGEKCEFFTKENLKNIYGVDFELVKKDEKCFIQIVN